MPNSLLDSYLSIPPVTRFYATSCFAATCLVQLQIVSPYVFYLLPTWFSKLEVWRLVTPFFFVGTFSFRFLIQLVWIVQYGRALEGVTFQFNAADYAFMLLFGGVAMLAFTLAVPFMRVVVLGPSMVDMLLYVWSRNFPNQNVSLMGLVTVQSFYLPFVMMGLDLMLGGNWRSSLLGILAGHLWWFLTVLHPQATGQQLLRTPQWLAQLLLRMGVSNVLVRNQQPAHPSAPGFRAFRGAGRRLAD